MRGLVLHTPEIPGRISLLKPWECLSQLSPLPRCISSGICLDKWETSGYLQTHNPHSAQGKPTAGYFPGHLYKCEGAGGIIQEFPTLCLQPVLHAAAKNECQVASTHSWQQHGAHAANIETDPFPLHWKSAPLHACRNALGNHLQRFPCVCLQAWKGDSHSLLCVCRCP